MLSAVYEFFVSAREVLYWIFVASLLWGVMLVPCWAVGAIGIICKSRLGHVFPLTIVLWVCLTIYTGLNTWLSRG